MLEMVLQVLRGWWVTRDSFLDGWLPWHITILPHDISNALKVVMVLSSIHWEVMSLTSQVLQTLITLPELLWRHNVIWSCLRLLQVYTNRVFPGCSERLQLVLQIIECWYLILSSSWPLLLYRQLDLLLHHPEPCSLLCHLLMRHLLLIYSCRHSRILILILLDSLM